MDQLNEFVDEPQKACCLPCVPWNGGVEVNRDHVPSKSLLRKPLPPNLPVVQVCTTCNQVFSIDEEYLVAFLSSVLAGSADPELQPIPQAKHILGRSTKLQSRIDRSKTEYETLGGEVRPVWKPESDRINRIVLKNARGHAFFEYGEPMLNEPEHVWSTPLETLSQKQRVDFDNIGSGCVWPEGGSRMVNRVGTCHVP